MYLEYLSSAYYKINDTWKSVFELYADDLQHIDSLLTSLEKESILFPPKQKVLDAFFYTKLEDLLVIIVGQDPYHGDNEANGLAFSVNKGVRLPPSLRNIFFELKNEYEKSTDVYDGELLIEWAKQGVLLLNSSLSVIKDKPNSLKTVGWSTFTDKLLSYISMTRENIVFMLWGKFASSKAKYIENASSHLVLTAQHPSPFSAYKGFLGCNHFITANSYLVRNGKPAIKWV